MIGVILFGFPHLMVLAVTAVVVVALCISRRRVREAGPKLRLAEWTLAAVMCLTFPAHVMIAVMDGRGGMGNYLPLHVCDLAAYVGAIALVTRGRIPSELVYFWGIGATLQALVTPAGLHLDYPDPGFFIFFINHSGIVITAIYVVVGRRDFPESGAVFRVILWTHAYLAVAAVVNYLYGTNYAFLCEKPTGTGNLFDFMGPWPWYLVWLELAILATTWILYLPFSGRKRRNIG